MQSAVATTRVVAPQPVATARHGRRQQQQMRRQRFLAPLAAAAVEETAALEAADDGEAEWDKEVAYERFEALLDQFNFSFQIGDKVGGRRTRNAPLGAGVDLAAAPAARRSTHAHRLTRAAVPPVVAAGARHRGARGPAGRLR